MARFRVRLTFWALSLLIMTPFLGAQSLPLSGDRVSIGKLARPAGIIFSGVVVRIERGKAESDSPASIRIVLRVEEAVRGCYAGETIEIAEWAELWARSDRYRVGQHVLLFLYPRNAAGLTSPVAGGLGIFVLGPHNLLQLTPQQASFLSSQSGGRPTPGESTNPTKARAGLRSFSLKDDLIRGIQEEE